MRRHDLNRPYQTCDCEAHKRVRQRYKKRSSMGKPALMMTSAVGTIRRVQALACLGYSPRKVGLEAGLGQPFMSQLLAGKHRRINMTTARAIADVYERWAMHPAPPSREATYARNRAAEAGWMPPLAWDDIDAPGERPKGGRRAA